MKIKEMKRQHRRDFWADFICEHCGHVEENVSGYDDDNFHKNVIPALPCPACQKVSPPEYQARETKYQPWEVV